METVLRSILVKRLFQFEFGTQNIVNKARVLVPRVRYTFEFVVIVKKLIIYLAGKFAFVESRYKLFVLLYENDPVGNFQT